MLCFHCLQLSQLVYYNYVFFLLIFLLCSNQLPRFQQFCFYGPITNLFPNFCQNFKTLLIWHSDSGSAGQLLSQEFTGGNQPGFGYATPPGTFHPHSFPTQLQTLEIGSSFCFSPTLDLLGCMSISFTLTLIIVEQNFFLRKGIDRVVSILDFLYWKCIHFLIFD